MNTISDMPSNHHSWWSRPIGLTVLVALLGICLAVIVFVLASSNVASERSNDMKPASSSQQSTTSVQVDSAQSKTDTPLPADKASSSDTSQSSTTKAGSSKSSVQVTVNGEQVPVPDNGSVHRTVHSNDGQTTVDVSTSNNGQSSNNSSSSLNLNVSTHSSSFSSTSSSSVTIGGTTENN